MNMSHGKNSIKFDINMVLNFQVSKLVKYYNNIFHRNILFYLKRMTN